MAGNMVPQNPSHAYFWLELAARNGIEEAARLRDILSARMTAPQLQQAKNLLQNGGVTKGNDFTPALSTIFYKGSP